MVVLGVLLASLLPFRSLGVGPFCTWQVSAAWALAVMFLFTGSAPFTKTKEELIGMVPRAFPGPRFLVYLTGVLEVLGAVGLLVPATRTFASFGLVLLLVAVFPANVDAARKEIPLRGKLPAPLWLRGSMQLLFIGMTLWVAPPRSDSPGVYMSMMRDLGGELPDEWLAKAQSCEAPRLRRLASGLKKDLSAVRGGLTEG